MSLDEQRAMWALVEHVKRKEGVITNALYVFADHMREAAKNALAAYEAGESNALITNDGYRHSAGMFTENAERAQQTADELIRLLADLDEAQ